MLQYVLVEHPWFAATGLVYAVAMLLYVAIWLAVVMGSYGIGFLRALLLALALAFLSWLVSELFGIRTFRSG